MTRRKFMLASGVMAGIAAVAPHALAAEKQGGTKLSRFGDVVIPPEHEGKEKHVPHIQAPASAKAGEPFMVTVVVGKDVPHPNLIEHHIKWIQLYAKEEGERPVVHVGTFDLGPTYAQPNVTVPVILKKSSTLYAIEYCNIHGVWDNSVTIAVQ